MNVSKQLKQGQLQTQIGTPYYMSPEIWNNKPYDERCDIWSLGCMIYELASLRPPFLGDSFAALKRTVVLGRYPALPRVYSASLERVIAIMLRVNSKERPTTTQLLAIQEIAGKAELMESQGMHANENHNENGLIGTIKVPQLLKKLNEALPKACYPEPRKAPSSSKEDEIRHPYVSVKPPLPPSETNNENRFNIVPTSYNRKVLAPIVEKQPQDPSQISNHYHQLQPQPPTNGVPRPNAPRPPAGNPQRAQHHHRVW